MDIQANWKKIRQVVNDAGLCSITTVNPNGTPHVTPTGLIVEVYFE